MIGTNELLNILLFGGAAALFIVAAFNPQQWLVPVGLALFAIGHLV